MTSTTTLPADIEALADSFAASADALHKRIIRAIRQNGTPAGQAITREQAQALFDQEVALRQQAHALYADAVRYATAGLGGQAQELLDLAARARDRIRRIERAKDLSGVAAALLAAAAAIAAVRPEGLGPALEDLKEHLEALQDADKAAPEPKPRHTMG
ncbi:hypothetical protein IP92_04405 [Pseudoduganella flava]|uniref:Phasin domain-containing protein n=1 Tax=Pseudoduganella flava TaxID=871742 RepID=A0A562PJ05_9BURK|nr:hypothetical protein [Pseudoduganella flava]QGZ42032.1 hypothetical protein GO485_25280 [Pseudoduganella flava]TWI44455.1 hypothetical protein IP92_04405 [Pseudoduganella flava]